MRVWTVFWVFITAVLATFVMANWAALSAETTVDLVVTSVTAPLGLVMVGLVLAVAVLFMAFVVWLETRAIVELGKVGRAASGASDSVSSHLAALEHEVTGLRTDTGEALSALVARLAHVEQVVKDEVGRANAPAPRGVTGLA